MSPVIRAPYPTVAAAPTIYLKDTFTDTNSKAITAHTMDVGPGWSLASGTAPTIQSNKLGNGNFIIVSESGQANYQASIVFTMPANNNRTIALLFRYVDTNNYLFLLIPDTTTILLRSVSSGSANTLATATYTTASSTSYELKVVASGNSIKTYANGTLLHDMTSSLHTSATKVGLQQVFSGGTVMDTFLVTSL